MSESGNILGFVSRHEANFREHGLYVLRNRSRVLGDGVAGMLDVRGYLSNLVDTGIGRLLLRIGPLAGLLCRGGWFNTRFAQMLP